MVEQMLARKMSEYLCHSTILKENLEFLMNLQCFKCVNS